jgi:anaerobic selenocysteine-containing dehydrogenase
MALKRRDFLKIVGGASFGFPLINCAIDQFADSSTKIPWAPGIESWVPTVCKACQGGCGILVRKIDDRAVKVEGNPLHPLNRGRVCPKGQAGLQLLYSPARIKQPLKKVGSRDSGKWQPIEWDEAISILLSKLRELRDAGKAHTVAFVCAEDRSSSYELVRRFLKVYGSSNFIMDDSWAPLRKAQYLARGVCETPAPDLEKTRYILSFGTDFMTNWPTLMENQRIYSIARARQDVKIIQIEPRFSLSASRADRWIPIRPGTEGLFALGIASVIIKDGIYNWDYIQKLTERFEDWKDDIGKMHPGFKSTVLKRIQPSNVADLTGIPLRTIIEIAREFAATQPSVAMADYNLSVRSGGLFHVQAINSLNTLVGNIDKPGGILSQREAPLAKLSDLKPDERTISASAGDASSADLISDLPDAELGMASFLEQALSKDPYAINGLFLLADGLAFQAPLQKDLERAISEIPFMVSFSCFLDDISALSDLILPDVTYFEKWQERQVPALSKTTAVGIGQPVVPPLYQCRPYEEVILELAKRMGKPFQLYFPWNDFKELLDFRLRGLYETKRGSVFAGSYEEAQLRILEERGWWISQEDSFDSFMKLLKNRGGWEDPVYHYEERGYFYQNPQKKIVFFIPEKTPSSSGLPFEQGHDEEFTLILYLYDLPFRNGGEGSSLPWYQENLGFRFDLRWKSWVELNPRTAKEAGIGDGDQVWVETLQGKMRAVAKVFPGIVHGVLGMPLGKEEGFLDKPKTDRIRSPLSLVEKFLDKETGIIARKTTWAKIYHDKKGED